MGLAISSLCIIFSFGEVRIAFGQVPYGNYYFPGQVLTFGNSLPRHRVNMVNRVSCVPEAFYIEYTFLRESGGTSPCMGPGMTKMWHKMVLRHFKGRK